MNSMSNPNWRTKSNPRVFVRYENSTCSLCQEPLEVGQRIMPHSKKWICVPCWNTLNPTKDIRVVEAAITAKSRTTGWEHDPNHHPHPVSQPCAQCDHLFGNDAHLSLVSTTPPSSP